MAQQSCDPIRLDGGTRVFIDGVLAGSICGGDCNRDGYVTIDELMLGVNVVMGEQPRCTCPALTENVLTPGVSAMVRAVSNAMSGCP